MYICPQCREKFSPGELFCGNCGTQLPTLTEAEVAQAADPGEQEVSMSSPKDPNLDTRVSEVPEMAREQGAAPAPTNAHLQSEPAPAAAPGAKAVPQLEPEPEPKIKETTTGGH